MEGEATQGRVEKMCDDVADDPRARHRWTVPLLGTQLTKQRDEARRDRTEERPRIDGRWRDEWHMPMIIRLLDM